MQPWHGGDLPLSRAASKRDFFTSPPQLSRCSSVVEQGFHKAKVGGSIPPIGTKTEAAGQIRPRSGVSGIKQN